MISIILLLIYVSIVRSLYSYKSITKISRLNLNLNAELIIGLNKYSHDTSIAIINKSDGKLLFTQAKERITGKKHDGGSVHELLQYGLDYINAKESDISLVVSNNHIHRVLPFDKRIPFYSSLNYIDKSYSHPLNTLSNVRNLELSHHLAHAYSGIYTSPFKKGIVVVMDGMGESYRAMSEDMYGLEKDSGDYFHDLKLLKQSKNSNFIGQPNVLYPGSGYREAESAYFFENDVLTPLFKRWSREQAAPEIYNYGFEYHESLGAVYSRISAYLLGDWNSCGKVMGLSSWANKNPQLLTNWYFNKYLSKEISKNLPNFSDFYHKLSFFSGNPYTNDFTIDWELINSLNNTNDFNNNRFNYLANIANSIQSNLEDSTAQLVKSISSQVYDNSNDNEKNLLLTGGVALNSVVNGKITNELGFKNIYIPPAPGDEGIALGCAYYGYLRLKKEESENDNESFNIVSSKDSDKSTHLFSPYQGRDFTEEDIEDVLADQSNWIDIQKFKSIDSLIDDAANSLANGEIIAWFQGRSEFGQRALGARSILADPRNVTHRQTINQVIKEREWYRPLAPSILSNHLSDWFDIPNHIESNKQFTISPYMSITVPVKIDKQKEVPAICHIDGTARLQVLSNYTTTQSIELDRYIQLISKFYNLTTIPMILNTSFNRKGKPIVETPFQAINSYLSTYDNHLNTLYINKYKVTKKQFLLSSYIDQSLVNEININDELSKSIYSEIDIYTNPIYLYEVTQSTNELNVNEPLKIRIQIGSSNDKFLDKFNDAVDINNDWLSIQSQLHLDILLLIQSTYSDNSFITLYDLYESLTSIYNNSEDNSNTLTYSKFYNTLKDLYSQQLIYLSSNIEVDDNQSNNLNEEDVDFNGTFPGVEIIDLR